MNEMLHVAKKLTLGGAQHLVGASDIGAWRSLYSFKEEDLAELGYDDDFVHSPALRGELKQAVSPRSGFRIRFSMESADDSQKDHKLWKIVHVDELASETCDIFYFKPVNSEVAVPAKDSSPLLVSLPKSVVVFDKVLGGEKAVEDGDAIGDWVSRKFYQWDELVAELGNNLGWFTNVFLSHMAIAPGQQGNSGRGYLLPTEVVPGYSELATDWVLDLGEDAAELPVSFFERGDYNTFTLQAGELTYDFTPADSSAKERSTKKKWKKRKPEPSTELAEAESATA
jgi:hypothetical protein